MITEDHLLDPDHQDAFSSWLNETHWVEQEHPATYVEPMMDVVEPDTMMMMLPRRRKVRRTREETAAHRTGSAARTEGFYKLAEKEKKQKKYHFRRQEDPGQSGLTRVSGEGFKGQDQARDARSQQRKLQSAFAFDTDSELLKFNQLKYRRSCSSSRGAPSTTGGSFANEDIAADEMVIDSESIIDATKCGNLARFINRSCAPNSYARIVTVEGFKLTCIYSKQPIKTNEEITYDYKFPIEDDKIKCLCGSIGCRGTLN